MADVRLTQAAESDIVEILAWSEARFGSAARVRYERLILHDSMELERHLRDVGAWE